jgi:hypothetical protein
VYRYVQIRSRISACAINAKCEVPRRRPASEASLASGRALIVFLPVTTDQLRRRNDRHFAEEVSNNMKNSTQNLAACYEDAVRLERAAWQLLQALDPGSPERAEARTQWAEAISRTNQAWRRLTSQAVKQPHQTIQAAAGLRRSGGPPSASAVHHGH